MSGDQRQHAVEASSPSKSRGHGHRPQTLENCTNPRGVSTKQRRIPRHSKIQTLRVQASNHTKMPCQIPRGGEGQWRPVVTARRAIPCITFRKRVLCNMCNTMLCLSNNLNIDDNIHKHLTTHYTIHLLTCDILDMLLAHGGDFQSGANGNSIRTNGRIDKESNISNGIQIAIPISTDWLVSRDRNCKTSCTHFLYYIWGLSWLVVWC